MTNSNINQLICRRLLGSITEEEEKELQEWLQADQANRDFYDSFIEENTLSRQFRKYRSINDEEAWETFEENVIRQKSKTVVLRIVRYAAVFLLLAAAGATVWWYMDYTKVTPPILSQEVQQAIQQSEETGHQYATLEVNGKNINVKDQKALSSIKGSRKLSTKKDSEFWVTLEDGSKVHLNNNSSLVYPDNFGSGDRRVILYGEAYFMVSQDKRHKFVVQTQDGEVTAHGTEFNVKTQKNIPGIDDPTTEVVLVKGLVGVKPENGEEQLIKPGQKWTMVNGQWTVSDIDVAPYVAWNTGTFVFHDCSFKKLMSVLSVWYNLDVTYRDSDINNIRFTGTLDRYEDFGNTKRAIEIITGLKIDHHNGKVIIGK